MADTQTKTSAAKESSGAKAEAATQSGDWPAGMLPGFYSMQTFRQGALNFEHWIATNQELTRFMSYRIRKSLATLDAFAKCKTSQDFVSTVAKAASDTVHDYADEYDRVLAINLAAPR